MRLSGKDNGLYDITRKNVVHIGAYILPTEIFHCMYIRSAVDSINGKEYINYRTCMWACMYKNFKLCMCILLLHGASCINVL